jgi:adenosine kinase
MGAAGEDFHGYAEWLQRHGVDTSAVMIHEDEYCASFFCTTDQMQNQLASFYPGAMIHSADATLTQFAPDANLVIVSPSDPAAMLAIPAECRKLGIDFIFDPSQQTIRFDGEQLMTGIRGSRLLASNEYERSLIMDKTGLSEEEILAETGGWLITLGGDGSRLIVDGAEYFIPAVAPKQIVEPTGAGDAYRAGLMRGMQLGVGWEVAGRMGALAATYVLENFGPQNHCFTAESFVNRYRQNFDDEGALDALL